MEKIQYRDFQNCVRLTNGEVEIVVTTDFGPRIISYNFVGGENVLGIHPHAQVETALGVWKPYGGHRLWLAPENMPNSYAPDNAPIEYFAGDERLSARFVQTIETVTETQKEITVTLDKTGSGVRVVHKIQNVGQREIELAAWALTIMRGGGEVLIPNEPFAPYGGETLLPVRNLTVWSYTDLSDARWSFDREFIRLKVNEHQGEPQKIGVLNKLGWVQYRLEDALFTKRVEYLENAVYPDMNSNTEIYTAGSFIEVETLSPLRKLAAGDFLEHTETWELEKLA
jgi:hypothetical protein